MILATVSPNRRRLKAAPPHPELLEITIANRSSAAPAQSAAFPSLECPITATRSPSILESCSRTSSARLNPHNYRQRTHRRTDGGVRQSDSSADSGDRRRSAVRTNGTESTSQFQSPQRAARHGGSHSWLLSKATCFRQNLISGRASIRRLHWFDE